MKLQRSSAYCPERTFVSGRLGRASARRGRRCPAGAHAGAVGAARRLQCAARSGLAAPNSLRSLRSLRSNSGAESDNQARCARRARPCAAPRPRNRPHRAPPAATERCARAALARPDACSWPDPSDGRNVSSVSAAVFCSSRPTGAAAKARAGRPAARLGGAEKRRACGLARSASCLLTRRRCPSAVSAANVASSAPGPQDRASQGSRRAAPAASAKRRGPARTRLCCRSDLRAHCGQRAAASGRQPPFNAQARFMRRGSREARWGN